MSLFTHFFECYASMHTFDTKAARMKFHLSVVGELKSPFASRLSWRNFPLAFLKEK